MQVKLSTIVLVLLASGTTAREATDANPISKVLQLIDALAAKISKDAADADKAYHEYFEWCDDTTTNQRNEIKTYTTQKGKLEAKITKLTSDGEDATDAIERLAGSLSKMTGELDEATALRKKEAAEFSAAEAELVDVVNTLGRAIDIISREMAKSPAALAQLKSNTGNLKGLLQSLTAVSEAAAFNSVDRQKLLALVQSKDDDVAEDSELGAPSAATYTSQSGGIVDVLEDMKEKAEGQLSAARKAETTSKQNFAMVKQSLEDKMGADGKEMEEQKAAKSEAAEGKAAAVGDLDVTTRSLLDTQADLKKTQSDCIQLAADHQESVKNRAEELNVIAEAKKILVESTGGAVESTYSLVQVLSGSTQRADVANVVKQLAKEHHSLALSQLASRIATVMRYGSVDGGNPFGKVQQLIKDMIAKLEGEGAADAEEKAFCDEQMSKTEAKKSELEDDQGRLSSKIEQATAKSAELKEQVKALQAELAKLAKEQTGMDKIRRSENAAYKETKADLEQGLAGVQKALQVLQEYYASKDSAFMQQPAKPQMHSASGGAAGGIINILQVAESDIAKSLATLENEESDAQSDYDKVTQENKVATVERTQAVKYKTQEYKGLDKSVVDNSADLATVSKELSAVNEYYAKIKGRCIAKPESYEERKKRREAEIAGLKQALDILESETALVQLSVPRASRRGLRGGILMGA